MQTTALSLDNASNHVVLVGVDLGQPYFDATLAELGLLAKTAGLSPVAHLVCKRLAPDAALFVGSGKVEEIKNLVSTTGAAEVVFDQAISPAQQRNLERTLGCAVYDRIYLILEIFSQRAQSSEGKLQVELARMQYLLARLVRRWTHMERQRGGIGARSGPGETQIELDRRMTIQAIARSKARLKKVQTQRNTQRQKRQRRGIFRVALVGYTNAGKSTLFNALTKANAYTEDQLFATLDPTTRQLFLQQAQTQLSLSDTVGFIRDLPHELIAAFQATLQEAADADLLLHVVDRSNVQYQEQIAQVESTLREIRASHIPQIVVFGKIDALPAETLPHSSRGYWTLEQGMVECIYLSAQQGKGMAELREALAEKTLGHYASKMA